MSYAISLARSSDVDVRHDNCIPRRVVRVRSTSTGCLMWSTDREVRVVTARSVVRRLMSEPATAFPDGSVGFASHRRVVRCGSTDREVRVAFARSVPTGWSGERERAWSAAEGCRLQDSSRHRCSAVYIPDGLVHSVRQQRGWQLVCLPAVRPSAVQ